MCGWSGDTSCFTGGWWWIIPMAVMALCMLLCFFRKSGFAGRRFRFPGSTRQDDGEEMKKEVKSLKEEINKLKQK